MQLVRLVALRARSRAVAIVLLGLLGCGGNESTGPEAREVVSLGLSTITASAPSLIADGVSSAIVTVVLNDSLGHPIGRSAGVVALYTSAGSLSTVTDRADGTYKAVLTAPTKTGTAVLRATLDGNKVEDGVSIALTAGTLSLANSSLAPGDSIAPGNGRSVTAIMLHLRDANGNYTDLGVESVTLASTAGTLSGAVRIGPGFYLASLTASTVFETAVVTATVNAQRLPTASVRFQGNYWMPRKPLPAYLQGLGVAVDRGILYAIGGGGAGGADWPTTYSSKMYAYDPGTELWTPRASMESARVELGTATIDGIVYAVGGYGPAVLSSMEAYDPGTDRWTPRTPMPTPRRGLAVGVVDGILYAIGGKPGSDFARVLSVVEAYDPVTNRWSARAPMPTARTNIGVAVVDGVIYAIGGFAPTRALRTVEAYDPKTDRWTTKAPLPGAYGQYALGVGVMNNRLYAIGGIEGYSPGNRVDVYDPATDRWRTTISMPSERGAMGVGVIDGLLYAVGGADDDNIYALVEALTAPLIGEP
jgi:N-acetylneuraminic acid mutarotase